MVVCCAAPAPAPDSSLWNEAGGVAGSIWCMSRDPATELLTSAQHEQASVCLWSWTATLLPTIVASDRKPSGDGWQDFSMLACSHCLKWLL